MADLQRWIREVFARGGLELQMGFKLRQAFVDAGLPNPPLEFDALMGGGAEFAGYEYGAATLRSILPMVVQFGLATADEVDIDTFAERLRAQTIERNATISTISLVSAWTRTASGVA